MASEHPRPRPAARRPVRALVAWMSDEARERLDRGDHPLALADAQRALRGRGSIDQTDLIAPPPDVLADHFAAVRASESARRMLAEGWQIAWVNDLRRIIAAQPLVVTDRLPGEPADPSPRDLAGLAHLTLPVSAPPAEITYSLNEPDQTWSVSSPNPNLRISGTFGGEIEPGVQGFGFLFSVMPSYVSVAEHHGRLILRDGYHRAYRLLAAGITQAPAFVRRLRDDEDLFHSGMLTPETYLGDRPPTLADYHDDATASDAWIEIDDTRAQVRAAPATLAIGTIG